MLIIKGDQKDIARWAMEYAIKKGCSQSRVSIISGLENSFEYRDNQLDKLQQSSESKLYIEVFVDGRYGSFSTNRLDRQELEQFIAEGIKSTNFLSPDVCRVLPDSDRYFKGAGDDLLLLDSSLLEIDTARKIELAKSAVDEVVGKDDRIISVTSSYYDGCSAEYMLASNGFEAETSDSACSLKAEVTLRTTSDARAEGYWSESDIFWNKLPKDGVASKALERAIGRIGQSKIQSGKYNMLLDNRVAARLLSPLVSAMYGASLQQKSSFLLEKLGKPVASPLLTIVDKPHLVGNFGARWFDGEGVATSERNIIEKGVLSTYFIDTYHALKMNVDATIASPSIIEMELGQRNFGEMLSNMHNGLWVSGFNGGNCNSTTGDFSFGVEGFLVENGVIARPVSEMNITGNILELWDNLLEVGCDLQRNTSWRIPSLLFGNVSFSGV